MEGQEILLKETLIRKRKSSCHRREQSTDRFSLSKILVRRLIKNLLYHKLANFLCTFSFLEESFCVTEFQVRETNWSLERIFFNILNDVIGKTQPSTYMLSYQKLEYEVCPESIQPFEYLEKRLHGLDITWQPVRGDLTVHL
jgi:hypothetical protein